MKVLVIEDDTAYAELIARYLKGLARELIVVGTWEEAEPHILNAVDIYWIDWFISGYADNFTEVKIGQIREDNKEATILVVSGNPMIEARALKAGADLFECKTNLEKQGQVIAILMSALLNARRRGANTEVFLHLARQFHEELIKPTLALK